MVPMGIEDIKNKILEDAKNQKKEILAEARRKAEEITKEGQRNAEKRKENIISQAKEEASDEFHRLLTIEKLDSRKKQLTEKQKAIEEAFEKSLGKLAHHPRYDAILEKMLIKAAKGGEELLLSPRDHDRLGNGFISRINKQIEGTITLATETRDIQGGFILRTTDMEINESFEEKIRSLRDEIEVEVARMLFEG
jgi:V/A-type H+-transporting ATPase subunit E